MTEGPLAALDAVEQATGEKDANVLGYCLGGTLLACTLAYMTAKKDKPVKSATYFTAMMAFKEAGDLGVFIAEVQPADLEEKMTDKGYIVAADLATPFPPLTATHLIRYFVGQPH